jgi:hypothetical protein
VVNEFLWCMNYLQFNFSYFCLSETDDGVDYRMGACLNCFTFNSNRFVCIVLLFKVFFSELVSLLFYSRAIRCGWW